MNHGHPTTPVYQPPDNISILRQDYASPNANRRPGGAGADVIQYAFGANANLYSDVLSVPPDALQAEIQSAFFDRRYELYEVLSKEENALTPTERHFAERRMDAIVAAYRILSNPSTRAEYDEVLATGGTGSGGFSTPNSSPKRRARQMEKEEEAFPSQGR